MVEIFLQIFSNLCVYIFKNLNFLKLNKKVITEPGKTCIGLKFPPT